jgi:serine/threonine protein phosphatase PrpC
VRRGPRRAGALTEPRIASPASASGLSVAVCSDQGKVRGNNEDAWGRAWLGDAGLLVCVCDGMGGHEAGEVASRLAVDTLEAHVRVTRDAGAEPDPRAWLYHGLMAANARILEQGQRAGRRGMGTTAVAAVIDAGRAWVALVGDSRLLHIRGGHVIWRTLDHTRVQSLLDRGVIQEDEVRGHPDAGMLTRALGHARTSQGDLLEPEVMADPLDLMAGDVLVLCSDGLHDLVDDWEIASTVAGRTSDEIVARLVSDALDRGGHDNVTVQAVVIGDRAGAYDAAMGRREPTETADVHFLDLPEPGVARGAWRAAPIAPAAGAERAEAAAASVEARDDVGAIPLWFWVAGIAGVALIGLSLILLAVAIFIAA